MKRFSRKTYLYPFRISFHFIIIIINCPFACTSIFKRKNYFNSDHHHLFEISNEEGTIVRKKLVRSPVNRAIIQSLSKSYDLIECSGASSEDKWPRQGHRKLSLSASRSFFAFRFPTFDRLHGSLPPPISPRASGAFADPIPLPFYRG